MERFTRIITHPYVLWFCVGFWATNFVTFWPDVDWSSVSHRIKAVSYILITIGLVFIGWVRWRERRFNRADVDRISPGISTGNNDDGWALRIPIVPAKQGLALMPLETDEDLTGQILDAYPVLDEHGQTIAIPIIAGCPMSPRRRLRHIHAGVSATDLDIADRMATTKPDEKAYQRAWDVHWSKANNQWRSSKERQKWLKEKGLNPKE